MGVIGRNTVESGFSMRVLWITNRPIGRAEKKLQLKLRSGTWMEPALEGLNNHTDICVCVASIANVDSIEVVDDGDVTHFLVPNRGKYEYQWKSDICKSEWRFVLSESRPDLIMIWGTEYAHGLCALTIAQDIPCVIEMQGIMDSVWKYYYGGLSTIELFKSISFWDVINRNGLINKRSRIRKAKTIEKRMIELANNVIVENEWATCHIQAICPKCNIYYHNLNVDKVFLNKTIDYRKVEKNSIFCSAPGYPLKGFHYLLRAIKIVKEKHPDIKLYVPGISDPFSKGVKGRIKRDGYEKYIVKLIETLGLRHSIVFLGRLSSNEMAERMSRSEVMVIPSAIENHSITLREAMAIGIPCIAAAVGGVPEVISHKENGLLYRYEDYEQCAYYINLCLADSVFSRKIGNHAKESMSIHLEIEHSIEQLVGIYHNVLGMESIK